MAYYIALFSPETYRAFSNSTRTISGFRERHRGIAGRIKASDTFVGYVTGLSRWVGLLEVVEGPFVDSTPIFVPENDPFVVRFRVKADAWLELEQAIPIHESVIWRGLSFTRDLHEDSLAWTGKVRGSLVRLEDADGDFLREQIKAQNSTGKVFPLDDQDQRRLATHTVRRPDKLVTVSVPDDVAAPTPDAVAQPTEVRESIKIQALLAQIGEQMGMSIWIPKADRGAVLKEWQGEDGSLIDRLPLNYDDTTLRTIEQIDVLWLRRRSIVRAFEVEHTTSVYSGILRMADLLALQPNMEIKLHIVAPEMKRDKVFLEIRRPVFSLLERGPLAESCTYISYDALRQVAKLPHLIHTSDTVLDEYAEEAE